MLVHKAPIMATKKYCGGRGGRLERRVARALRDLSLVRFLLFLTKARMLAVALLSGNVGGRCMVFVRRAKLPVNVLFWVIIASRVDAERVLSDCF
jgi:hypothetical protein